MGAHGRQSALVVNRCLEDPEFRELLHRFERVDDNHDIPYLAGYSTDGKVMYRDRHLPEMFSYEHEGRKKEYNPQPFIYDHEAWEKAAIDAFGWKYQHAHELATAAERRAVLKAGLLWKPYQEAYKPFIKADEHERIKKVPHDLDLTPYEDDPRLLRHLKKVMH